MTSTTPRDMAGVLFRELGRPSDRHPEMTGHIIINGVRYRLAGWINESKSGRRYLSLKASPDRAEPTAATTTARSVDELAAARNAIPTGAPTPTPLPPAGKLDDDIPW